MDALRRVCFANAAYSDANVAAEKTKALSRGWFPERRTGLGGIRVALY
jgi:hypothetical protein